MERAFIEENRRSRQRLTELANRLTDQDLWSLVVGDWSVGAILAHLAFWDYRALVLVRRWKESGIGPSQIDIDGVNDAMLPLLGAISPRDAANLAISAAETIDRELEQAPDDLIAGIEALGSKFRLKRSEHRQEHLDEIEHALGDGEQSDPK